VKINLYDIPLPINSGVGIEIWDDVPAGAVVKIDAEPPEGFKFQLSYIGLDFVHRDETVLANIILHNEKGSVPLFPMDIAMLDVGPRYYYAGTKMVNPDQEPPNPPIVDFSDLGGIIVDKFTLVVKVLTPPTTIEPATVWAKFGGKMVTPYL
jgi:hypothetical protein